MKKQILKIAGVKSEKEFYKKFPTEEAFMAKHGKELKKAQIGTYMTSEAPSTMYQPVDVRGIYDEIDYQLTGMTAADRAQIEAAKQAAAQSAQSGGAGGGGGIDMSQLAQFAEMAGGAKKGKKIPKAQNHASIPGLGPTGPQLTPSAQNLQQQQSNWGTNYNPPAMPAATKKPVNWAQGIPIVGKIVGGIQKSKEAKKLLQQTVQQEKLTDVMGQAAASRPKQQPRRQYVRPEDMAFQPEQMFPSYGVGTNVLAEFGASVGGGEIMNTFAPNTLYDNLGYEPLNDSERYKQFYHGGKMHKAQGGFETFMNQQGGNEIFGTIEQLGAFNDGGGDIGSGIGEAVGSIIPIPGAKQVLSLVGRGIGSALDQKKEKTEASQERTTQNINEIAGQNFGIGIQQQFGANLQDGGTTSPYKWVSHTWQPQVITTFGDYKVKDLLRPPADADMLRAGGHLKEYTPPSAEAMSTERPVMQMGGELQTHWGGYAEPMSYNPYLPDGGETIMFRGQSHDESDGRGNTGIGITYGENPVEVERGEPAVKLQDGGTGESNLTVFGNIKITNAFADMLADPKAKGKKFKTYVADLSKQENKQNKLIDKSLEQLDELDVQTSFDKLALGTLQANIEGANAKLKDLADKKINAASLQNAINDTKEENLLEVTDKGDVLAKKGADIPKAQRGFSQGRANAAAKARANAIAAQQPRVGATPVDKYKSKYGLEPWKGNMTGLGMATASELSAKEWDEIADKLGFKGRGNKQFQEFLLNNPQSKPLIESRHQKLYNRTPSQDPELIDGMLGAGWQGVAELIRPKTGDLPRELRAIPPKPSATPTKTKVADLTTADKKNPLLAAAISQALNYLRPSDVEQLDPNQLIGEMYALATNQLEPVQAQTFQPQLGTPYDISLQDILNENEAAFRSQQRLLGYNPAAQSMLNAQKYQANQRVLGEQFRLNQAEKQRVYEQNRNLLNQAQLQNLGILDRQYERQAQALSKTKATTQAALSSIASKYAQNKLENRTLATYENLYNYRFDPRFRAQSMQFADFNIPTVSNYSADELEAMAQLAKAREKKQNNSAGGRNGAILKALKNL